MKAIAPIIVPFWPSSELPENFNYISDYRVFAGKDSLWQGRNTNPIFGPKFLGNMFGSIKDGF